MDAVISFVRWLPLCAVALHLVEEFAWPGGFGAWYRWYRPERAASVTTGFLVRINALFVVMALAAGLLGLRPYGVALWLVVASIAAANGVFHLWATLRRRRYTPGLVTGVLVYLPLAAWGFWYFASTRLAPVSVLIQALAIGPAYHLFSAWNHRRRAARMARSGRG
jgi:hypothetical protein